MYLVYIYARLVAHRSFAEKDPELKISKTLRKTLRNFCEKYLLRLQVVTISYKVVLYQKKTANTMKENNVNTKEFRKKR